MSNHLKKYCRAVRRNLPCSGKLKQKIVAEIDMSIRAYMEENPTADYAEIERRFGSPRQITSAYLDEMDHQVLARELKIKNRIVKIVAAALIAALLMFGITLGIVVYEDYDTDHGYIVVTMGDTIILS